MAMSRKTALRCVAAIRNDREIGRGTCSTIDEAYTDEELMAELIAACPQNSIHAGVKWMRELEAIIRDREADIRGEIF